MSLKLKSVVLFFKILTCFLLPRPFGKLKSFFVGQPPSAAVPSTDSDGAADDDEDDDDDGAVTATPDLIGEHPLHKKTWFWLVIGAVVLIPAAVVTTAAVRYRKRRGRGTTDRINTTSGNEIIRQQMSPLMPRGKLNDFFRWLVLVEGLA